jgi:hypothetical protein
MLFHNILGWLIIGILYSFYFQTKISILYSFYLQMSFRITLMVFHILCDVMLHFLSSVSSPSPILLVRGASCTVQLIQIACLALRFFWFGVQLIHIACLALRFFWFGVQLKQIACLALRFFWIGVQLIQIASVWHCNSFDSGCNLYR